MISALRKIENRGELPGATSAVMEMCVDNPREGFADLFATHPSVRVPGRRRWSNSPAATIPARWRCRRTSRRATAAERAATAAAVRRPAAMARRQRPVPSPPPVLRSRSSRKAPACGVRDPHGPVGPPLSA